MKRLYLSFAHLQNGGMASKKSMIVEVHGVKSSLFSISRMQAVALPENTRIHSPVYLL